MRDALSEETVRVRVRGILKDFRRFRFVSRARCEGSRDLALVIGLSDCIISDNF